VGGFTVGAGEFVGLTGLAGSGKSAVLKALFGMRPHTAATMLLHDRAYSPRSARSAVEAGVGYVSEDRHGEAIFAELSVRENTSAGVLADYWTKKAFMHRRREDADTRKLIARNAVRAAGIEQPIGHLSGGNQQKLVLGTWIRRGPKLLLLDEPTQGVDVRARNEIYDRLRKLATTGCGVVVASSDLDELLILCDRILVVTAGTITHEFETTSLSRETLAAAVLDGSALSNHRAGA
jgi:ribose transport system ATP-binding protein